MIKREQMNGLHSGVFTNMNTFFKSVSPQPMRSSPVYMFLDSSQLLTWQIKLVLYCEAYQAVFKEDAQS